MCLDWSACITSVPHEFQSDLTPSSFLLAQRRGNADARSCPVVFDMGEHRVGVISVYMNLPARWSCVTTPASATEGVRRNEPFRSSLHIFGDQMVEAEVEVEVEVEAGVTRAAIEVAHVLVGTFYE